MAVEIAAIGAQRPFVIEALEQEFTLHKVWESPDKAAALKPAADRIRGVVSHGMAGLPTAVIEALPKLEICAINGVGLETTDLDLARKRGIVVTTAPVLYDDVSDTALMLGMAACRRLAEADRFVRSGEWLKGRMTPGRKFSGKRAGILGLGRIGMALARRLEGFGMTIGYHDPLPKTGVAYKAYSSPVELAATRTSFSSPPPGGRALRTSWARPSSRRSARMASSSMWRAAGSWTSRRWSRPSKERRLGAAGLDVFADEPKVPDELIGLDNVVLTPHIASSTEETQRDMGQCVLDNIRSWFAGKGALTPVA